VQGLSISNGFETFAFVPLLKAKKTVFPFVSVPPWLEYKTNGALKRPVKTGQ